MQHLLPALAALVAAVPATASTALVGGLAVSSRAEPRFTRDVDLAVAVASDADAEALVLGLVRSGWRVAAVVEHDEVHRLATVRLVSEASRGVLCDLLFSSSGIEPEIVESAEDVVLAPGLVLATAQVGHLIAVKLLSVSERRLQDRLDLAALAAVATAAEWERAHDAVRLITERGYARGRDLVADLRELRVTPQEE